MCNFTIIVSLNLEPQGRKENNYKICVVLHRKQNLYIKRFIESFE